MNRAAAGRSVAGGAGRPAARKRLIRSVLRVIHPRSARYVAGSWRGPEKVRLRKSRSGSSLDHKSWRLLRTSVSASGWRTSR